MLNVGAVARNTLVEFVEPLGMETLVRIADTLMVARLQPDPRLVTRARLEPGIKPNGLCLFDDRPFSRSSISFLAGTDDQMTEHVGLIRMQAEMDRQRGDALATLDETANAARRAAASIRASGRVILCAMGGSHHV